MRRREKSVVVASSEMNPPCMCENIHERDGLAVFFAADRVHGRVVGGGALTRFDLRKGLSRSCARSADGRISTARGSVSVISGSCTTGKGSSGRSSAGEVVSQSAAVQSTRNIASSVGLSGVSGTPLLGEFDPSFNDDEPWLYLSPRQR